MKLVVELEIDQAAYDAKYGPGTEWWDRYKYTTDINTGERTPLSASAYEFAPDKVEQALAEMIVDVLYEGFWDWRNLRDGGSALKITVNGKQACGCCGKIEGHKDWCVTIAGPEASAEA